MAIVPRLPKKITLARNVFAMVNERDKKHHPHDKRENLKRCEIKQLPNCWPGKPFKVSRFSLLFLLFPSFFSGIPICLLRCVGFSPILSQRVATSPDHLPREILALPSQFTLSLPQLAATSLIRRWTPLDVLPFLRPLPFSCPLCARYAPERIWFDPIRRRRLSEANCGIIRRIPFG